MVLPAPAPDAHPAPAVRPWVDRIVKLFRLVERGFLVLVDRAHDAQLGALVRALSVDHPALQVVTEAPRVEDAPAGSVVVLATRVEDALWLNIARPIFAKRALRVVLWSKAEVTAELSRRAPDFFSWIERHVECPGGPPPFAVAGLRAALRMRARAVAFRGEGLEEAFAAALPGRSLRRVNAALIYEGLLGMARSAGRDWIAWSDLGDERTLRRVRWVIAQSGRRARDIVIDAPGRAPGLWPAHARTEDLGAAISALGAAGADSAGRLAALLDLEPEAILLTAAVLGAGMSRADIEDALREAPDGGAAVAAFGRARMDPRAVAAFDAPPPVLRAFSMDPEVIRARAALQAAEQRIGRLWSFDKAGPAESTSVDPIEAALRLRPSGRAAWAALAREAARLEEPHVAFGWRARAIDFAALQRLDEEADTLIREERWSREEFERLWRAALIEAEGDESWLGFLSYPADPEWLPPRPETAAQGHGYQRIPRDVAQLIHKLERGWSPRVVLSRTGVFSWNDQPVPSAHAEITWEGSSARVEVTCSSDDAEGVLRHQEALVPGRVYRNTLRTEHASGWRLEAKGAVVETIFPRSRRSDAWWSRFTVRVLGWRATRGQDMPSLWLAPLEKPLRVRLGNLVVVGIPMNLISGYSQYQPGWGWGHWRLQGAYTYSLVSLGERPERRQFLIIEPPAGVELDVEVWHRDMMALEFVWGEPLQCPVAYGLRGAEVVACMSTGRDKAPPGARTPAIWDHLEDFEYWIEPFFSKLSRALRAEATPKLILPVTAALSRHRFVDETVRELCAALTSFATWTLRGARDDATLVRTEAWSAWLARHDEEIHALAEPMAALELLENLRAAARRTPRQRLDRALRRLGIEVPRDTLDEIALYDERLRGLGALTEELARSDHEHERQWRLVETLRTVLVAMVAATVGYHGVIRGIGPDEGPPSWWHVDPEEEKALYRYHVAVTAPAPVSIPRLAPGEVLLLVEHDRHRAIVEGLLSAAGLPVTRVHILSAEGRAGLRELVHAVETPAPAILAGWRPTGAQDPVEELRSELGLHERAKVFCAVPDVEAWLLADDDLARRRAGGDPDLLARLDALPVPDKIPDPFEAACRLVGPPETWTLACEVNIQRAAAQSSTLRHFLGWMAETLGVGRVGNA